MSTKISTMNSTLQWWQATPGADEEFGPDCLAAGNLDNDPAGHAKLATGSYAGLLRLYYPRAKDFRVEDLMLEAALPAPILQLAAGTFLGAASRVGLAVLHPRALAVYSVGAAAGGGGGAASYFTLSKAFEHALERPACCMTYGAFGGASGRNILCVQSMDGEITIIEGDRALHDGCLSKFLLPGPLAYHPRADSFITYNSQMEIDSYKYSSFAMSAAAQGNAGSKRKLQPDWSLLIGEEVVSIHVARFSSTLTSSQMDTIVISSHSLFCLKENGQVRSQKRIDCLPISSTIFPSGAKESGAPEHHLMIGTHQNIALIYRDMSLIWSTSLPGNHISIRVSTFGGVAGLIATLADNGALTISYLGTDPPSSAVSMEAKELNYEAMDQEHRRLLRQIREASSETKAEPKDVVQLRAQVPTATTQVAEGEGGTLISVATVRLFVNYVGPSTLENVTLLASCTAPIFLATDTVLLPSLASGNRTPTIVPLTFRCRVDQLPVDLGVAVVATYNAVSGEPRCSRCEFVLPFGLVCTVVAPVKNPKYRITLEANRPPPSLLSLFEDVFATAPQLAEAATQAAVSSVSIQYLCGLDATVLISKNAGRLRVQSNSFEGLWLLSNELVRRLTALHSGAPRAESAQEAAEPPFRVAFNDPLPLQEYFELVDDHLRCRIELARLQDELAKRAHQFRVIEKRLLVRLKDRNPAPLQNLELLFEGTYQQLLGLAGATEHAQQELAFHGTRLAAGTRLLLLLIRMRFDLDAADAATIEAHLSPLVEETADQGWEERTDAALAHLLRTSLAKASKHDSSASSITHQLTRPADASKLKKHITLVCDRLHKGLRPRADPRGGGDGRERKPKDRSSGAAPLTPPMPPPPQSADATPAAPPVAMPPGGMPAPPPAAVEMEAAGGADQPGTPP